MSEKPDDSRDGGGRATQEAKAEFTSKYALTAPRILSELLTKYQIKSEIS